MAGAVNIYKHAIDTNAPSIDIGISWGGNGYGGDGGWFFYNVTDGVYLYNEKFPGSGTGNSSSGSFDRVVPLQYGKEYLIKGKGRDTHDNSHRYLYNTAISPLHRVQTYMGAGAGGSTKGPHEFEYTISPITQPASDLSLIHI